MLENLKKLNSDIKFYDVNSPKFARYGRIIKNLDLTEITAEANRFTNPESGSSYIPSVEAFERLDIAKSIQNEFYGSMPTQIGYCWGHNTMLNATEWHTSSEINIAVTPLVLLLANIWDIKESKIHSTDFKAFYLPEGTAVEVYATSLHYCPCEVQADGFKSIVGLPKGTNTDLDINPEDKRIFRKNKWLICHAENTELIEKGVFGGIIGTNYEIKY